MGRFFGKKKDEASAQTTQVRAFHNEMHSILSGTIAELEAMDFSQPVATGPAAPTVAEFVVALDAGVNVIGLVPLTDPIATSMDLGVAWTQDTVRRRDTVSGQMVTVSIPGANLLVYPGSTVSLGIIWRGPLTGPEYDRTAACVEGLKAAFRGRPPTVWGQDASQVLYATIRASFGLEAAPTPVSMGSGTPEQEFFAEVSKQKKELRERGYATTRLYEIAAMMPAEGREALERFRADLRILSLLEARLYSLDMTRAPDDAAEVLRRLRTAEDIPGTTRALEALEERLTVAPAGPLPAAGRAVQGFDLGVERDPGFADRVKKIEAFAADGYDVRTLWRLLYAGEQSLFDDALTRYGAAVDRLEGAQGRLLSTFAEGYEDRFESIRQKLGDPTRAATVEAEIESLVSVVQADQARQRIFTGLRERLESWTGMGFNTAPITAVLTKDTETIVRTFRDYTAKVEELAALEEKVEAVSTPGFEDEAEEIRRKLRDPDRLTEVREDVRALLEWAARADEDGYHRQQILQKIQRWRKAGYDVSPLDGKEQLPLEALADLVGEFDVFLNELARYSEELDSLYTAGLDKDAADIRVLLHDIRHLPEVKRRMLEMRASVEERAKASESEEAKPGRRKRKAGEPGPPVRGMVRLAGIVKKVATRLPPELWGKDPKVLAEQLLEAEYARSEGGELIVKLGRVWYYGDPGDTDRFLTSYTEKFARRGRKA